MAAPVVPRERDLRRLAGIVSEHRDDIPAEGVPLSLLSDLAGQIPCDSISFEGFDSRRQVAWFCNETPAAKNDGLSPVHWQHYWHCEPCSYPDQTGDLRTVIKIADFYSARQWHSTGMYTDLYRPKGFEHELMLSLPSAQARRFQALARRCGCSCSAAPAATSPRPTGRCSRCCARTCTRPTWTPSVGAIPSRS